MYDSGLAILGGWTINYLVVVRPRRRDRLAIYTGNGHFIADIARTASLILERMYQDAGEAFPLEPDHDSLGRVLAVTRAGGASPLNNATWTDWIVWRMDHCDQTIRRIEPVYPYFDAELIQLITRIATAELAEYVRSYRLIQAGIPDQTLLYFKFSLLEQWERCHELNQYFDSNVKPYSQGVS